VRTFTLLFFAVASLLLGASALAPAVVAIGVYQSQGATALPFGVYGYFVVIVAVAAPVLFLVAALVSAFDRREDRPSPSVREEIAEALAELDAPSPRRGPDERYRRP
jgi:membrane protein implicated in regulation of membrane protease activity